jgi:hypothetical protein
MIDKQCIMEDAEIEFFHVLEEFMRLGKSETGC